MLEVCIKNGDLIEHVPKCVFSRYHNVANIVKLIITLNNIDYFFAWHKEKCFDTYIMLLFTILATMC